MSEVVIRDYRPEDYPKVVELYSSTCAEAPFFARDGQYLSYFLSYPGVRQDSVFVAASKYEVEGIAIIAINEEQRYTIGKIVELWASEVAVGNALVQKAVEYCCDKGADKLEASPPVFLDSTDTFAGWQNISRRAVVMAKPLSLRTLIEALFDTATLERIGAGKGFVFVCDDETIKVEMNGSKASIKGKESRPNYIDIMIRASHQTLLEVIFNAVNPYMALLTGRIQICPLRSIFRGLKMLRTIRISQPWTVAIVDGR